MNYEMRLSIQHSAFNIQPSPLIFAIQTASLNDFQ